MVVMRGIYGVMIWGVPSGRVWSRAVNPRTGLDQRGRNVTDWAYALYPGDPIS
jgi:hypothetical protein